MKALVTGAGGFIGQALVPRLLGEGYRVAVLARDIQAMARHPWAGEVNIVEGDVTAQKSLRPACRGQEVIIHCAGHAHHNDGQDALHWQVNYLGTARLLAAAVEAGARRMVFLSSSKAASPRRGAYGESKHRAEEALLEAHGRGAIEASILRPTAVYGPGMKGSLAAWLRAIDKGLAPPLPPVDTRIAMIGAADLCRAVALAAVDEHVPGRRFLLADGTAYHVKALEAGMRRALDRAPRRLYLPRAAFRAAAAGGESLRRLAGIDIGFDQTSYNTLFLDEYERSPAFGEATGFRARQDFFEALPSIVAEVRSRA